MLKKMFNKKTLVLTAIMALSICGAAFATGTADASVTGAFQGLADDAKATMTAVAAIGVTIMAIFLAWKYGRKIFNHVAK